MDEKIGIVFEGEEMMVLDKPGGLVVTNEGRTNRQATLEDWLRDKKSNNLERAGIVHRLDKGTSGLIVVAKTKKALDYLKSQFKKRKVQKKYIALICGDLPREGGMKVPIGRSRFGFGKFGVDPDGKKAETRFRLISKYKRGNRIYSLVDIDLLTGRTHQIRVHFSNLRWPLVGDVLYGGEPFDKLRASGGRPFLHAHQISFTDVNGKVVSFESEIPSDLKDVLAEYEKTG
ncbi:MAG: RluA family pseudouridine synthase [Candidatus Shapirobacteria bacterium]|jgi:23S rRNA pseudouridine1911/1915/1917 synthase